MISGGVFILYKVWTLYTNFTVYKVHLQSTLYKASSSCHVVIFEAGFVIPDDQVAIYRLNHVMWLVDDNYGKY